MSFILTEFGWEFGLISIHKIIQNWDTRDPTSLGQFAMGLQVVLTACKVPHEVAPIHEIDLVGEEEIEVFAESRTILCFLLSTVVITHFFAFDICPRLIGLYVIRVGRVHTREEHFELVHILVG